MTLVEALTRRGTPLLLLIPFSPRHSVERDALVGRAGLSFFSDVIYRAAARFSCSVLDLRLVLDNPTTDLAAPLALSSVGAMKVVARLMQFVVKTSGAVASAASLLVGADSV